MYGEDRRPRRIPSDPLQNTGRSIRALSGAANAVKTPSTCGSICFVAVWVSR